LPHGDPGRSGSQDGEYPATEGLSAGSFLYHKSGSFYQTGALKGDFKKPENPVHQKSGELGENGAITFFPGPHRAPNGFLHAGEKNPG